MQVTVTVKVVSIGTAFIGVTTLGGITIRGRRCATQLEALHAVFYRLGNDTADDDAAIGLDLEMAGSSIQQMAELGDGNPKDPDGSGGDAGF